MTMVGDQRHTGSPILLRISRIDVYLAGYFDDGDSEATSWSARVRQSGELRSEQNMIPLGRLQQLEFKKIFFQPILIPQYS